MDFGKRKNSPDGRPVLLIPLVIGAAVALVVGGFIIAKLITGQFAPEASAESKQIDDLFEFMLVIGGAIFLLVEGLLLFSIVRFRKRGGDEADGPPIHGNTTLELVWTAVPAIIVVVLVIYSYKVWVDILRGKMGATKAIASRKLKTQGPFLQLLQGGNRIIRWVEILRTVPTEFEGSYAQYNLPGAPD